MKNIVIAFIVYLIAAGAWIGIAYHVDATPVVSDVPEPLAFRCRRAIVIGTPWDTEMNRPESRGVWYCEIKNMHCVLGMGCAPK